MHFAVLYPYQVAVVRGHPGPFLGVELGKDLGTKMAARTLNRLSVTGIAALKKPGLYADGGKLYLRVSGPTQKSWVFLFQWQGKTKEMGLGSLQDIGLAEARRRRTLQVAILARGENPIEVRDQERAAELARASAAAPLTLCQAALIVVNLAGQKTDKGRKNWLRSVQVHSGAMAGKLLASITTQDMVEALKPFWTAQRETADRMRARVEMVLDWGLATGQIAEPWANPVTLSKVRFHLEKRDAYEVEHRPAVSYEKAGAAVKALRAISPTNCSLACELIILTALRNGEGRAAQWEELDREAKVWTVPAARMKMKKAHAVPLSTQAVALLDRMAGGEEWPSTGYVFPSQWKPGVPVSGTSMTRIAQKAGGDDTSLHGWRATFKDWSLDVGGVSEETGEECLAHKVGNDTRNAYRRGSNLENRRLVMQAWADFLDVEWAGNVVALRGRSAA